MTEFSRVLLIKLYDAVKQLIDQGIDWRNFASMAGLLESIVGAAIANLCGVLSPSALLDQLLKAGVELNRDSRGNTPLHLNGVPDFARQLIGLQPDLLEIKNREGKTPFWSALRRTTSAPWEKKADFLELVQIFLQRGAALPYEENYFSRWLLKAIIRGDSIRLSDAVKQLIDQGINWQNFASMAELLENVTVAAFSDGHGHLSPSAMLDQLFKAGVQLSLDAEGNTLLHLAEDPTFAELLIKHRPSLLHIENSIGETPLRSTLRRATTSSSEEKEDSRRALRNSLQVLQVFVYQGASLPHDEDRAALRAFLKAAVQNHLFVNIIERLIDEGIDWSACITGEELLERVVDMAAPDSSLKAEHRFSALCSLLIDAGCGLKSDALKNILLSNVHFYTHYSHELMHLIEKKRAGSIRAIDPEGEILRSLVEGVMGSNEDSDNSKRFDSMALLRNIGFTLEKEWLRNCFLAGLQRKQIYGCHEIVKWMEKRKAKSVRAIDPRGEIFQDLVVRVLSFPESSARQGLALVDELLDLDFDLEVNELKNILLREIAKGTCFAYRELIRLFQRKRESKWVACDPEQEILNAILNRVFDNTPTGSSEWGSLLVDLGFEPNGDFLERFLVIPNAPSYFTSKFKEAYEHLIRAQKEPLAESDPEGALVAMVVKAMHSHAVLSVIRLYEVRRLPKMDSHQFHMGILDSLLAAGAVIPVKVDGKPLSELLDTPGLETAREAIALVTGKRMTKSARKNID